VVGGRLDAGDGRAAQELGLVVAGRDEDTVDAYTREPGEVSFSGVLDEDDAALVGGLLRVTADVLLPVAVGTGCVEESVPRARGDAQRLAGDGFAERVGHRFVLRSSAAAENGSDPQPGEVG